MLDHLDAPAGVVTKILRDEWFPERLDTGYRAARSGPDSNVPPDRQQAFYDPGLGTQPESGGSLLRAWRTFYNLVSQATGLGITHNIIDCYTSIIQLWRPGDPDIPLWLQPRSLHGPLPCDRTGLLWHSDADCSGYAAKA